ncbi:MAG: RluA family pseudouridine synthase [Candidatus Latescibacterota bacterium]|jgi:23S rRNA pseudouridine1911/1915/1917 synthase
MESRLEILYEDNHLLGVMKPGGLLTQGDRTGDETALELARRYVKQTYNKPGNVFLGLVHRIDRPVSGVLLFARTSKAASRLAKEFHARRVQKTYLAVTTGGVDGRGGKLVSWIERAHNRSRLAGPETGRAKKAELDYRVLARRRGMTLLEVVPVTGRHHQIRVQLAEISHPIVGDMKYGKGEPLANRTIALHAARLKVKHPTREEVITIQAPPPHNDPWLAFRSTIDSYFQ